MNVFLWECYYCEKGKTAVLPTNCPECGAVLRQPWNRLSDEERKDAWVKKMIAGAEIEMVLAS